MTCPVNGRACHCDTDDMCTAQEPDALAGSGPPYDMQSPSAQAKGVTTTLNGRKNPVRTEVRRLGLLMELKLRKNDFKGGWADMPNEVLLQRLDDEVRELREAILAGDPLDIAQEAADVANFAMMLADNAGGI